MDKDILLKILKTTHPFKYLDESAILLIVEHGKLVQFSDEDRVLTQGKKGCGLFILLEGNMKVSLKLLGKGLIHLATLTPGNFFGEISLLDDQPCTASIQSQGTSLCFFFKQISFNHLNLAFSKIRHAISQALIEEVIIRQKFVINKLKEYAKKFPQYKVTLNMYTTNITPTNKRLTKDDYKNFLKTLKLDLSLTFPNPLIRKKIELPNNHFLINHQQELPSSFYILQGAVKVGIITSTGFLKFAVLGPEHLICSTSLLNSQPEGLFVYKTIGITTLIELSSIDMLSLKEQFPLCWYQFYDNLIRHVLSLQKKLNGQILLMESAQQEGSYV